MSAAIAEEPLSADKRRLVLDAFAGALRREVYFLSERPQPVSQQLYNLLRWED